MDVIVLAGISCLVFFSAAVQHASTVLSRGVGFVMSDRSTPLDEGGFPGRAKRTLQNNLESALMMAPLAVILLVLDLSTSTTQVTCAVYLAARVSFTLAYWLGWNPVRSVSWAIGMLAVAVTFAALVLTLSTA